MASSEKRRLSDESAEAGAPIPNVAAAERAAGAAERRASRPPNGTQRLPVVPAPDSGNQGPKKLNLATLWHMYLDSNRKKPLLTKSITTGVLAAVGNFLGQQILIAKGKQKNVQLRKLVSFVLFGAFLSGPLGHVWLKFLNGRKTGLKGQQLVLYKIALDRLCYGPCFNAIQMSFVYKVSGQSNKQVLESLKKTFLTAQILNFKMWPFAQYINFNFIPPELQLLYMNFVALIWTVSLSMIMN